ncbi:Uu.00g033610.m01.CDS01 [Anthostomella pinea]|uniref:Uu.00g033610.m01.CDS01 n=1 Tax=Anthostomella pinea TaxID=933095 RepID=A0AAI8YDE9_9PEZI|nr:Uu.00g033610.m01.CDS01 [Anthostomella pinea]
MSMTIDAHPEDFESPSTTSTLFSPVDSIPSDSATTPGILYIDPALSEDSIKPDLTQDIVRDELNFYMPRSAGWDDPPDASATDLISPHQLYAYPNFDITGAVVTAPGPDSPSAEMRAPTKRESPSTTPDDVPAARRKSTDNPADHRERNRIAAHKCRRKQKANVEQLQLRERELAQENKCLHAHVGLLKEEVLGLKHAILAHGSCDSALIQNYIAKSAQNLA